MNYIIKYGIIGNQIDVTQLCLDKCMTNHIIYIPDTDGKRANIFKDPVYGVLKSMFIYTLDNEFVNEYNTDYPIYINTLTNEIFSNNNVPDDIIDLGCNLYDRLIGIHKQLKIEFGSLNEEVPEQLMALRYLTGTEKVLEIGGNIGRNSLLIGYILNKKNNSDFVTMECDPDSSRKLKYNRDINGFKFKIETAALSKRKLIQRKWDTITSDIVLNGYTPVNTITWEELNAKYNIEFDTLVLDCEGAFYYILMDMPEILKNIKTIIMENDYKEDYKKKYVDDVLIENNFKVDYNESGGWGPCYDRFFEVWKRTYQHWIKSTNENENIVLSIT
jgi:FkbM family methyltransferase